MIFRFPCKPQTAYIVLRQMPPFIYATVFVLLLLLSSLAAEPNPN